jgi:hypothetical protein
LRLAFVRVVGVYRFDEPNPAVVSRPASSPNCDSSIALAHGYGGELHEQSVKNEFHHSSLKIVDGL